EQRTEQRSSIRLVDESSKQQITYVKQPQNKRGRQPRVPSPINSPCRFGPDRAGYKHDGDKNKSYFGAGHAQPIKFRRTSPHVQQIGKEAQAEHGFSSPTRSGVKIKNPLQ